MSHCSTVCSYRHCSKPFPCMLKRHSITKRGEFSNLILIFICFPVVIIVSKLETPYFKKQETNQEKKERKKKGFFLFFSFNGSFGFLSVHVQTTQPSFQTLFNKPSLLLLLFPSLTSTAADKDAAAIISRLLLLLLQSLQVKITTVNKMLIN